MKPDQRVSADRLQQILKPDTIAHELYGAASELTPPEEPKRKLASSDEAYALQQAEYERALTQYAIRVLFTDPNNVDLTQNDLDAHKAALETHRASMPMLEG